MNVVKAKSYQTLRSWLKNASSVEQGAVVSSCTLKESLLKDIFQFIFLVICIIGLAVSIILGLWNEATRLPVILTVGILLVILAIKVWGSEHGVADALNILGSTKKIAGWHFSKFALLVGTISLILTAIVLILPIEVRNNLIKTDLLGAGVGASIAYAIFYLGYLGIMFSLIVLYQVYKHTVGKAKVILVELVDGTQEEVTVPWYKYVAVKLHLCTFYDVSH